MAEVIKLQQGHGEWNEEMALVSLSFKRKLGVVTYTLYMQAAKTTKFNLRAVVFVQIVCMGGSPFTFVENAPPPPPAKSTVVKTLAIFNFYMELPHIDNGASFLILIHKHSVYEERKGKMHDVRRACIYDHFLY